MKKFIYIFLTLIFFLSTSGIGFADYVPVLPIARGGTSAATQQNAIDALTGTQSSGTYLRSNGTHASLTAIQAGDVPTLNQNTTGTADHLSGALSANQLLGSLTAVAPTGQSVPSCSTSASALLWTSGTGFSCNTSIAASSATNATNTAITDDTSTNATMYLTWVTANSGNLPQKVTSTKLTWNPSSGLLSTTSAGLTGTATDTQSINATSTDGYILTNTTSAANNAQQWSPRVRWTGQGWETNTSASQAVDAIAELKPVQGAASPSFNWVLSGQINGGGYGALLTVPSGGGLNLNSGTYQINGTQIACSNLSNAAASCSTDTTNASNITTGTLGATVQGNITTTGTITSGTWHGTAIDATHGGTAQTTWATGDLLYGSGTNTLGKLGANSTATNKYLQSVSSGAPSWVQVADADLSVTDVTTNNASTSNHGFLKKLDNTATHFMNGAGNWATPLTAMSLPRTTQTTTYAPTTTDNGSEISFAGASADATWTIAAGATNGTGWFAIFNNPTTHNLTIKVTTNTIDGIAGATGFIMYPGEVRLVQCDGTNYFTTILNGGVATFTSSTTWQKPPGYSAFQINLMSSGGSGASRTTTGNAGGGAGGSGYEVTLPSSVFVAAGSTETVTVGGTSAGVSGNTAGNAKNASSLTVNGTAFSNVVTGAAAATAASSSAATGGASDIAVSISSNTQGNGESRFRGGTGGDVTSGNVPEGSLINSVFGGGGGGASSSTAGGVRTGGASLTAGAGGAGGANTGGNGTNGTAPGGGGGGAVQGGTSGSGAAGQVIIRGII